MVCSMSREGNCWDNAPIESWFNSFKNERYDGIRYATHDAMKAASFEPRISRGFAMKTDALFERVLMRMRR
jgi:transposase InsO family protein